ncbi:hypothetical protein OYB54_20680, partial [Escherichia coli]|nr:hypothetical protein [Escherichia coli]MCY6726298.1 hypothetical protein [Escherichia coli]MCY6850285.1 hypothetical protein [Escherichia coli]MCY6917613.1 hypothetical protein [Escherichia coli]
MNKTSLALLTLILFITTHCANANKKALTIPLDSTKITPLVIFYKNITNGITELFLSETEKSQTIPFNQQEITIPVKGENFLSPWIANDTHYYELGQFEDKDNIFKIIIYNTIGESDTPLLNGFAPIFPDTCYHLTHYWPAAVDIPVASDNPVHYAD